MRKSCTRTASGWPIGRHARPAFLKSPTNSFFFVSTEITGWPAAWNCRTCAVMWRNWASRSGCGGPSRVLRLACKLYPAALKSSRTSWWLTRWPMLCRVCARVRVLFAVQRRGEFGAPEVVGSTSPSRSRSSVGSLSIVRFRPPPGRRTRPAGMRARDRSSPSPRAIVDVEIPVARATRAMPPRPRARASVAAHTRRDRSVSVDASARYFARQPRRSTHVNLPSGRSDSFIYCLTNPYRFPSRLRSPFVHEEDRHDSTCFDPGASGSRCRSGPGGDGWRPSGRAEGGRDPDPQRAAGEAGHQARPDRHGERHAEGHADGRDALRARPGLARPARALLRHHDADVRLPRSRRDDQTDELRLRHLWPGRARGAIG